MELDTTSSVTLPSNGEEDEECMPKIINTVSLQGCSELSFSEEPNHVDIQSFLYPTCEIKEETPASEDIKPELFENGLPNSSKGEEENIKKEKKRLTLTHLPSIKQEREPKIKASTSRRDDVVDSKRLALQESLFKTKELFDTFLRVCQDHENTQHMERVVEKLGKAYGATKQEFLGSQTFQNMLEAETEKVNTSNTKPWLNLKLVMDELKHNKKSAGSKLKLGESEESQDAGSNDDEPVIECPKKRRHLKKLEKVLRAINLKIKKLEEREVDWEEEDNSAYCKLDRYRAQFTKIYTKICEIKGKLPDADRPYLRKVSFAGTTYPHINRCIEKYYNKHREFPDFQDIKKLVTLALKQEGIEMAPIKIHAMAAAAFKEFGEMLKRLRQYDDYDVLISYLDQQVDPARNDEQLQEQLNMNALLFKKKEQEVIDKFVERENTRGVSSESGEDSDSKFKRKKKKILITNPDAVKKSDSPGTQHLSSSEESDEDNKLNKRNHGFRLSSDSAKSDSETEEKRKSVKGKGKELIGKKRIVKKGIKKSSPNKSQMPKTAMSSDEESAPGNTKESLTSYLGLTIKGTPKSAPTKESKNMSESEDDITCINEIQEPAKGIQEQKRNAFSDNSDSDKASKSKSVAQSEKDVNSNSHSNKSNLKYGKKRPTHTNTVVDSDTDIEPITVINRPKQNAKAITRKQNKPNQARKRTGAVPSKVVPKKNTINRNLNNTHETISDNSESEKRTNSEESESENKKSISDIELSSGTKDLSDSSDEEDAKAKEKRPVADDAIVILSEDIIEESGPAVPKQNSSKPQEDSSDSDDICILSQIETERRTIAPRRIVEKKANLSAAPRKTGVATSTPNKSSKPLSKRRLSNQSNSGNSTKMRKLSVTTNGNNKQTTLPQIINGASRKVLHTRAAKPVTNSRSSTPEHIPLIELD